MKVGSRSDGELTFDQFNKLLDVIQSSVELSTFSEELLSEDTDDNDTDDDSDDDDEQEVQEIYDMLKKNKKTLSLVDFIQWEDVQELLESKALSKDDLAKAIANVGIAKSDSELTFQQVSEIVNIL